MQIQPLSLAVEAPEASDDALAAEAQRDPAAFALLYRRYLARVYRYLYTRTGNPADAEDLTSQVFLAALERLERYRPAGHFAAWLFSIARRKAADHYRASRPETALEALPEPAGMGNDPLSQMVQEEDLRRLAAALAGLEADEQELLRLRFAAGLDFKEIARLLGRKTSAVKMATYRLLERLERRLEAEDE